MACQVSTVPSIDSQITLSNNIHTYCCIRKYMDAIVYFYCDNIEIFDRIYINLEKTIQLLSSKFIFRQLRDIFSSRVNISKSHGDRHYFRYYIYGGQQKTLRGRIDKLNGQKANASRRKIEYEQMCKHGRLSLLPCICLREKEKRKRWEQMQPAGQKQPWTLFTAASCPLVDFFFFVSTSSSLQ